MMSCFLVNKSNTRYEVFKDSERLFNSKFTQIILHSGIIVFIRDLLSESIVLTLATKIKYEKEVGSTRVSFVACATEAMYEIETLHEAVAASLYNQIKLAAGQAESKVPDEASMALSSTILPPIQQVTNTLANCLEQMTTNFVGSLEAGGQPEYQSTYNNGTYSVRFGQETMDFQVDGEPDGPVWETPNAHSNLKRQSPSVGMPGFREEAAFPPPTAAPKRPKYRNDYGRQIFVGNLPPITTETELSDIFAEYGEIEKIQIVPNNSPGTPYIAFIFYEEESSAHAVLKNKANIQLPLRNGSQRRLNIQQVNRRR